MPNKPLIIFFKAKNTFQGSLVWNLFQNFYEDRPIIQAGACIIFFWHFGSLIRMAVALTPRSGHFMWCGARCGAVIQPGEETRWEKYLLLGKQGRGKAGEKISFLCYYGRQEKNTSAVLEAFACRHNGSWIEGSH